LQWLVDEADVAINPDEENIGFWQFNNGVIKLQLGAFNCLCCKKV
jgi:hypothetical protein